MRVGKGRKRCTYHSAKYLKMFIQTTLPHAYRTPANSVVESVERKPRPNLHVHISYKDTTINHLTLHKLTATSSNFEYSLHSTVPEDGLIGGVDSHTHLHLLPLFICVIGPGKSHNST